MTKRAERARASGPAQRGRAPRGRARHGAAPTPTPPDRPARHRSATAGAAPGSQVPVAEQARRSRIEQGLPPTIQDPATLAYIARLLRPTIGKPRRAR